MIRARIRAVTASCILTSLVVFWLVVSQGNHALGSAVTLMGWWPISVSDIARSFLLTAILFIGPLYERGIVEGEWRSWFRYSKLSESLGGWIGWRNYIAVSVLFWAVFWCASCFWGSPRGERMPSTVR